MRADRLQSVRDEFGGPLPDGLRALSDDELEDLAVALAGARDEQSRAVDGAIDGTLRYLPWPLRVVVRKVLIG
ncbi:MAG: hypothetical protein Q8O56_04740 [Solirubrobacteraceae bacterium]|nr:hypothetical protein [Solirubrobacteraceae bacterium]